MALIGEQLDEGSDVCGAVVSIRPGKDRVAVWTKTASNETIQVGGDLGVRKGEGRMDRVQGRQGGVRQFERGGCGVRGVKGVKVTSGLQPVIRWWQLGNTCGGTRVVVAV